MLSICSLCTKCSFHMVPCCSLVSGTVMCPYNKPRAAENCDINHIQGKPVTQLCVLKGVNRGLLCWEKSELSSRCCFVISDRDQAKSRQLPDISDARAQRQRQIRLSHAMSAVPFVTEPRCFALSCRPATDLCRTCLHRNRHSAFLVPNCIESPVVELFTTGFLL